MSSCHRDERLASLFADVGPAERKRFRFHADIDLAANASSIDISGTKVCEVPWLGFESLKVVQSSPCVTKANWSDMGLRDISFK